MESQVTEKFRNLQNENRGTMRQITSKTLPPKKGSFLYFGPASTPGIGKT
jgi:hypothetical protein